MEKKFFTIDEVNQLLPQIQYHFRKMLESKKEMALASRRLKKMGAAPQLLEDAPPDPRPEVQDCQGQVRHHYQNFKKHTLAIEQLGGRIKDFELGRVEFLSRQGDRIVSLIWQMGVTERVHPEEAPLRPFEGGNSKSASENSEPPALPKKNSFSSGNS